MSASLAVIVSLSVAVLEERPVRGEVTTCGGGAQEGGWWVNPLKLCHMGISPKSRPPTRMISIELRQGGMLYNYPLA